VLFLPCFVLRFGDLTKLLQKGIGFSFTVAMMPEGWKHVTFQRLPTNLTTSLESQELCDVATVCVQSCVILDASDILQIGMQALPPSGSKLNKIALCTNWCDCFAKTS
jgi:hypothetical protein